jgi:hypothetical protein
MKRLLSYANAYLCNAKHITVSVHLRRTASTFPESCQKDASIRSPNGQLEQHDVTKEY